MTRSVLSKFDLLSYISLFHCRQFIKPEPLRQTDIVEGNDEDQGKLIDRCLIEWTVCKLNNFVILTGSSLECRGDVWSLMTTSTGEYDHRCKTVKGSAFNVKIVSFQRIYLDISFHSVSVKCFSHLTKAPPIYELVGKQATLAHTGLNLHPN